MRNVSILRDILGGLDNWGLNRGENLEQETKIVLTENEIEDLEAAIRITKKYIDYLEKYESYATNAIINLKKSLDEFLSLKWAVEREVES